MAPGRDLRILVQLFAFLHPYRKAVLGAMAALLVAAAAVLGFGVVLQRVVDHGLSSGSSAALNQALLLFLIVVTVMAASVAARVYLVTWIGERVVADIRKAVFAQVLKLERTATCRSGLLTAIGLQTIAPKAGAPTGGGFDAGGCGDTAVAARAPARTG